MKQTHQELARHCEPKLTMRHTHAQIDDKVKALDALPSADSDKQDAQQRAVIQIISVSPCLSSL
jgi:hypothetical protein